MGIQNHSILWSIPTDSRYMGIHAEKLRSYQNWSSHLHVAFITCILHTVSDQNGKAWKRGYSHHLVIESSHHFWHIRYFFLRWHCRWSGDYDHLSNRVRQDPVTTRRKVCKAKVHRTLQLCGCHCQGTWILWIVQRTKLSSLWLHTKGFCQVN